MRISPVLLFLPFLMAAQQRNTAGDVVFAERSFSSYAVQHGVKEAFLSYLDTAGVIFRPHAVNGYRWYRDRPSSKGILSWQPEKVEIASSGDFAYSTGPWEFRKEKPEDEPAAYGHFFSVWEKNRSGEWKVILDEGISYGKPEIHAERLDTNSIHSAFSSNTKSFESAGSELFVAESLFTGEAAHNGFSLALEKYAAGDVRLYRNGEFPFEGIQQSKESAARDSMRYSYQILAGDAAQSGDLGFTYGWQISSKQDTSNFVHVWRKNEKWQLVLAIHPPMKK